MTVADKILLVGMMGAGKTTVGASLAAQLGWGFVDTDEEIEARSGRSVPALWNMLGEAAFRTYEAEVVAHVLADPSPAVVSLGGGAVLHAASQHAVRHAGRVVWLRAEVATLVERVGSGDDRPLLRHDPQAALSRIDDERRALYQQLADVVVDVDGRTPDEIVAVVTEAVTGTVIAGAVVAGATESARDTHATTGQRRA